MKNKTTKYRPLGPIPVISEVAKDIIQFKFKRTMTLGQCQIEFYKIMRKHGIKQGTPSHNEKGEEVGRLCNNFEWSMCKEMFIKSVGGFFTFEDLLGNVPKDLLK